jgi:hypothetical protein
MNTGLSVLFAQGNDSGMGAGSILGILIYLALIILCIVGMWKVFEKAGQPGWGSVVPIYNLYLMLVIAGRPWWWIVLAFIPCVSLVLLVIPFDIAKNFGKGAGYGIGLLLLPFIFYPLLGFGDDKYRPVAR